MLLFSFCVARKFPYFLSERSERKYAKKELPPRYYRVLLYMAQAEKTASEQSDFAVPPAPCTAADLRRHDSSVMGGQSATRRQVPFYDDFIGFQHKAGYTLF